jgi:hypothetical protein
LTGGVTLRGGEVSLRDCRFEGSTAEDALNLVRAQVTLRGVEVLDSASDAVDVDFCAGTIEGGRIGRAGGDGIDVSGSQFEIRDSLLFRIHDKALSIGEASDVEITGVMVDTAGTGVASKDGSRAVVRGASFHAIEHAALMAYVKKAEYGPAELIVSGSTMKDTAREAVAQHGSRVLIDGREVVSEAVDVDALYEVGPMRKEVR